MGFKEYLVSTGLTEEQAESIVKGMPDNKFYLASEEKLDERYEKLKTQHAQSISDLENATKVISDFESNSQSTEEMKKTIEDYKTQLANEKEQRLIDNKNNAILMELGNSRLHNPKSAMKFLNIDDIELTDKGLQGLSNQLDKLQESESYLFKPNEEEKVNSGPTITLPGNPRVAETKETDPFQAKMAKYD